MFRSVTATVSAHQLSYISVIKLLIHSNALCFYSPGWKYAKSWFWFFLNDIISATGFSRGFPPTFLTFWTRFCNTTIHYQYYVFEKSRPIISCAAIFTVHINANLVLYRMHRDHLFVFMRKNNGASRGFSATVLCRAGGSWQCNSLVCWWSCWLVTDVVISRCTTCTTQLTSVHNREAFCIRTSTSRNHRTYHRLVLASS